MNTALSLKDLPPPPFGKSGWPWTRQTKLLPDKMQDGSEWPRISIITPSYNQGKFLEATIRSVLLQGYPNLEYIVIDGGSTDQSVEVIKKYENHLFYWISEDDSGQAQAINKGLKQSSGEILGWINSDDIYVKGAFYKIIKTFQENPDCIVVHGNRILINEGGDVIGWNYLPPFEPATLVYNVCSETAFWQRFAMDKTGLLKESLKFAIDLEFFSRLYQYGKFLKLDDYLGYFRCHAETKSSTIAQIGQEEAQREWKNLFGSENRNWQVSIQPNLIQYILTFVRYPNLIGVPYLLHRLLK
ncbi:MAG TPA: glycosyltransferase family 2 protein [Coleofasciculaceae cyanobacterium]|jgi:glycosyltransferase involved in cell wall biosynthesis